MKTKEDKPQKDKILNVTMKLMEQKSIDEISIREIANLANVNVASINYYYNSKENLFNEALDQNLLVGIKQWISTNIDFERTQLNDLKRFILFLHFSTIKHPGIARTRILNQFNSPNPNQVNLILYDLIYKVAKGILCAVDEQELRIKVSLVYASIANISCCLLETNSFLNTPLDNEENLNQYIDKIVQFIFN